MKRTLVMLSLATLLLGMTSAARADLNSFLRSVNQRAIADAQNFNEMLGRQFGVPVPDVEAIVRSVPDPADAFMIFQLGQMAHVEPAVVQQRYQRHRGQGWGRLAQDLGIKPGSPEFQALKRGDLQFASERGGDGFDRGGYSRDDGEGEHGRGHGHEYGNGRGHGRGHGQD
jgi:hypothetical protein